MTEQAVHAVEETLAGLPARLAKLVEPRAPQLAKFVAAIDIDSPLVLSFAGACTLVHVLGAVLVDGAVRAALAQSLVALRPRLALFRSRLSQNINPA